MGDTQPTGTPALLVVETTPTPAQEAQARFEEKHGLDWLIEGKISPRGVFKGTREEWMEAAAIIMGGWLNWNLEQKEYISIHRGKVSVKMVPINMKTMLARTYAGKPNDYKFKPNSVRYSCSLMDTGMVRSTTLAHCHYSFATGNSYHEIRMGVHVGGRKTKHDSARVADILLHEMIHTCAPRAGHGGAFKRIAETVGLEGKMTSTVASEELRLRIWDEVVTRLGRYPHAAVDLVTRGQRKKGSRLKKCTCPQCGMNFRTTRKWIEKAGPNGLVCPMGCIDDDGHLTAMTIEQ